MGRSIELYHDGRLYELEEGLALKVTETHGDLSALLKALQFSTAKTFAIAPVDQEPPSVVTPRGGRHINAAGLKLLTTFEGCELRAYVDQGGVWTIGYGHTQDVRSGMTITQEKAEKLLAEDVEDFENYVQDAVKVPLNEDQFSALVSFCFNVGPGNGGFGSSTLLKLLNNSDYAGAANQLPRWNKVGSEVALGLTRRRLAERSLFLSQSWEAFREYDKLQLKTPPLESEFVRHVQERLVNSGFADVGISGRFDGSTARAVTTFQQQKQLDADGIVGLETVKMLWA
jgi:lysozyme